MTKEEYNTEAEAIRPVLTELARGYLKSADDADDAVQDVLLKLWDMHDELHSPVVPLGRVLIRNMCIDRIRRHHVTVSTTDVELPSQPADTATDEQIDRMMSVICTLPSAQQVVLRLKHMDGMSTSAIAALTGSSEEAVRQTLSRARRAVLKWFTEKT